MIDCALIATRLHQLQRRPASPTRVTLRDSFVDNLASRLQGFVARCEIAGREKADPQNAVGRHAVAAPRF